MTSPSWSVAADRYSLSPGRSPIPTRAHISSHPHTGTTLSTISTPPQSNYNTNDTSPGAPISSLSLPSFNTPPSSSNGASAGSGYVPFQIDKARLACFIML
jgi:hypothetical protein